MFAEEQITDISFGEYHNYKSEEAYLLFLGIIKEGGSAKDQSNK